MITLTVNLGDRSYPILIGSGILGEPGILDPYLDAVDVLVVTNDVVGPIYLEPLTGLLGNRRVEAMVLPDGEANKTMETLQAVLDRLVDDRFARASRPSGGPGSSYRPLFGTEPIPTLKRWPTTRHWETAFAT